MEALFELIKLASVGVIAGAFGSYMAFREHRQKVWWELRVNAYKVLIESLSELFQYFDDYYNAEVEKKELNEQQKNEMTDKWKSGYRKVRIAADIGAFLYSSEVEKALNEFVSEMEARYLTFFDRLDCGWESTRKCLDIIVKCSKADLHLKRSILARA